MKKRKRFSFQRVNNQKGFWQSQMIMGLLTVGFGVAILVYPHLLQALVAGLFIMIGIFLILAALTLRKVQGQFQQKRSDVFDV